MRKRLLIGESPINCFSKDAAILSILWARLPETQAWIFDHNVQLAAYEQNVRNYEISGHFLDLYPVINCPFLYQEKIDRGVYEYESLISKLINMLNRERYIMVYLDKYYIKASMKYSRQHLFHPTLLYGYDSLEKHFYIADFYEDKYVFTKMSYMELFQSYNLTEYNKIYFQPFHQEMVYMEYRKVSYDFDVKYFFKSIQNYISGYHFPFNNKEMVDKHIKTLYGIDYYFVLIRDVITNSIDHRAFYILKAHKLLFNLRLDYLGQQKVIDNTSYKYLSDKCKILQKKVTNLNNMVLFYMESKKQDYRDNIIQACIKVRKMDYLFMHALLNKIKCNNLLQL